jgi:hypothetical protein
MGNGPSSWLVVCVYVRGCAWTAREVGVATGGYGGLHNARTVAMFAQRTAK